MQRVETSRYS